MRISPFFTERSIGTKTKGVEIDRERDTVTERENWEEGQRRRELVICCFEPIQPLVTTSGMKTNVNPSLSYSAYKSFKTNHNFSTAQ